MIDTPSLPAPLPVLPDRVKIPDWLPGAAGQLVALAEKLIPGQARGDEKRDFVVSNLRVLARKHDIEQIPDWIETPLENFLIGLIVDLVFRGLKHQGSI
jgi:hypothetical protein